MFSKQLLKAANSGRPHLAASEPARDPTSLHNKKKELEEIAAETLTRVIDSVDDKMVLDKLDSFQKKQFKEQIYDTLLQLLEESSRHLSQGDKQKVIQYVSDEIFGYGPINSLLADPSVTEIMVNGCNNIYVERDGKLSKTDVTFRDDDHVLHAINKIISPLGRRIDESSPSVDARMPDGSRVNAIIPPLSLKGPSITIRKFAADPFTVDDLIGLGTMSRDMAEFLEACVKARVNIIVSGGTGSGKTTTLNVLSGFIPDNERIITIEDTAELQLLQDNIVTLESRPANIEGRGQYTIRDLVINSLRMRPDRIVVGEVRGAEALDMLQAMNTGHDGSISTLHANNPRDALSRLETMVLMAGTELPLRVVREQINSAVELIIQQSRFSDGSRKITRISEVVGMEKEEIKLQEIFVFKQSEIDEDGRIIGEYVFTGTKPNCMDKLISSGENLVLENIMSKNAVDPEDLEDTEATENTEDPEDIKNAEYVGEPEDIDDPEYAGHTENTDGTENTEDIESPKGSEYLEDFEDIEEELQLRGSANEELVDTAQTTENEGLSGADEPLVGEYGLEDHAGHLYYSAGLVEGTDPDFQAVANEEETGRARLELLDEEAAWDGQGATDNGYAEHLAGGGVATIVSQVSVEQAKGSVINLNFFREDRSSNRERILLEEEIPPVEHAVVECAAIEGDAVEHTTVEDAAKGHAVVEHAVEECAAVEDAVVECAAVEVTAVEGTAVERTAEKKGSGLSSLVPENMRGISVPVNPLTGLLGYIDPGDRVDVLVSYPETNDNNGIPAAHTVAKNALVLDISGKEQETEGEGGTAKAVILAVTPEEAGVLAYAFLKGCFHLTLCPYSISGR